MYAREWAVPLGSLVPGEVIATAHVAGMALIALGLCVMDGRSWRFLCS